MHWNSGEAGLFLTSQRWVYPAVVLCPSILTDSQFWCLFILQEGLRHLLWVAGCRLLQPLLCQSLFLGMCHVVSCRSLQDMWMVVADRRIFHLGRQKKADDDSLELGTALGSNQGGGRCPEGFGARLWGQASAFVQEWRGQPRRWLIWNQGIASLLGKTEEHSVPYPTGGLWF